MLERCTKLAQELSRRTHTEPIHIDMLREYRMWFDRKGIVSEGEDGWPLPFVFEEKNILAFVDDWNGKEE